MEKITRQNKLWVRLLLILYYCVKSKLKSTLHVIPEYSLTNNSIILIEMNYFFSF